MSLPLDMVWLGSGDPVEASYVC